MNYVSYSFHLSVFTCLIDTSDFYCFSPLKILHSVCLILCKSLKAEYLGFFILLASTFKIYFTISVLNYEICINKVKCC